MMKQPKILAILAHPDDETLGFGGTLAHYANMGAETHLICATRGQRGWFGTPEEYPGPEALGSIRESELKQAARLLNIQSVHLMDYMDGELDQAEPTQIIHHIASHIQHIQPQIILTFDPFGIYGHPDHIAISQFTTAAIVAAASHPTNSNSALPHAVEALYYRVLTEAELAAYQLAFGDLVMTIDGVERRAAPWQEWAITHRLDTSAYVPQVWQAVRAHRSQLPGYEALMALPAQTQNAIFGSQSYYCAFSLTPGGRQQATELLPDTYPASFVNNLL
jgi:LmbE family N-acetylglucosaminyl deacetylase